MNDFLARYPSMLMRRHCCCCTPLRWRIKLICSELTAGFGCPLLGQHTIQHALRISQKRLRRQRLRWRATKMFRQEGQLQDLLLEAGHLRAKQFSLGAVLPYLLRQCYIRVPWLYIQCPAISRTVFRTQKSPALFCNRTIRENCIHQRAKGGAVWMW